MQYVAFCYERAAQATIRNLAMYILSPSVRKPFANCCRCILINAERSQKWPFHKLEYGNYTLALVWFSYAKAISIHTFKQIIWNRLYSTGSSVDGGTLQQL